MKRLFLSTLLVFLGALLGWGQRAGPFNLNAVGTSGTSSCAVIQIASGISATVAIGVTGTSALTLQPAVVVAGKPAVNTSVYPDGSGTSQTTIVTSGATNAVYNYTSAAGKDSFQVCVSAYTSGTAVVNLTLSTGSVTKAAPSSGAGSGTLTSLTPSTGILLTPNPITATGTVAVDGTVVRTPQDNTYTADTTQLFPVSSTSASLAVSGGTSFPCCASPDFGLVGLLGSLNGDPHMGFTMDGGANSFIFLHASDTPANMANGVTGTGATVLANSPTLKNPNIGDATATSLTLNLQTGDFFNLQPGLGFAVTGSVTSGTFLSNEAIKQGTTNATSTLVGTVLGSNNMIITAVTGSPDNSHTWVGQTSGAVYTPTAVPATPYIQASPAAFHILTGYGSNNKFQGSYNNDPFSTFSRWIDFGTGFIRGGGGANAAPTVSTTLTDDSTTLTYTGTGGVKSSNGGFASGTATVPTFNGIAFPCIVAPGTPSAGTLNAWCDSTDNTLEVKNSAGTIFKLGDTAKINGISLAGLATGIYKNTTGTGVPSIAVAGDLPGSGATTVNGQTCTLGSTCTIPLSANNAQTATYQVLASDFTNYKTITVASGTFTITLVASGTQPANGQYVKIINYGSGIVTVARSGQNINGGTTSLTLGAPTTAVVPTTAYVESDGTNYFAYSAGTNAITLIGKNWAAPAAIGGTTPAAGTFTTYSTGTNCAGVGTAANPSVATCTAAAAGAVSCATNASSGTCTVNTTAVTANSEVILTEVSNEGTRLSVTCNTTVTTGAIVSAKVAATSFTITLPVFTTNPMCFDYLIVN